MNREATLTNWINNYIDYHKTNITALAKKLDLKSRNSLQRVSDGTAGRDALLKVLYAIQMHKDELGLAPEDLNSLASIEKRIVEGDNYGKTFEFLNEIFFPSNQPAVKTRILGTVSNLCLETINPAHLNVQDCIVINACFPSTISLIKEVLEAGRKENKGAFSVRHYIIRDDDPQTYMRDVASVFPVILDPAYGIFFNKRESEVPISKSSNSILLRYENGEQIFILFESDSVCLTVKDDGIYEKYDALLKESQREFSLFNGTALETSGSDFMDIYEIATEDEKANDTMMVCPDFCTLLIPADVMKDVFVRSAVKYDPLLSSEFVDAIAHAHEIRVEQVLDGTQTRKFLFPREGFDHFCTAGYLMESALVLGQFTTTERIRILAHLYNQMQTNPSICWYLTEAEGIAHMPFGFCAYGTRKIRLIPIIPNGDVTSFQKTVEITDPEFIDAFLDFFDDEILVHHTMSSAQTADLIKSYIASLAIDMDREMRERKG